MKLMKKFILSLFLSFIYILSTQIFPLTGPQRAWADEESLLFPLDEADAATREKNNAFTSSNAVNTQSLTDAYACILTDDVYLYASSNERSGLFLLPRTYFVKILDVQTDFTKVEYSTDGEKSKKLTGYCKTEQLTFVDYVPTQPYFYSTFEVTYRLENGNSNYPFLTEITVTCSYYGEYPIGSETYCYVFREDAFGYVPKPTNFNVPINTEYSDRLIEEAPPSEEPTEKEATLPPTQIVTIVLLCLLAPILASLILRPTRKPTPYDDD